MKTESVVVQYGVRNAGTGYTRRGYSPSHRGAGPSDCEDRSRFPAIQPAPTGLTLRNVTLISLRDNSHATPYRRAESPRRSMATRCVCNSAYMFRR
jgi:hypothetical protein